MTVDRSLNVYWISLIVKCNFIFSLPDVVNQAPIKIKGGFLQIIITVQFNKRKSDDCQNTEACLKLFTNRLLCFIIEEFDIDYYSITRRGR